MKRLWILGFVLALAGCAIPYDGDGELALGGGGSAPDADARPIVFDTDLASDDLAALAFLLRRSDVSVEAVTIAATGEVGCDPGVDLVADLMTALEEDAVPIACGRAEAPGGMEWPQAWVDRAAVAPGLPRSDSTATPVSQPAPKLIGQLADQYDGALAVVAVGPLTNLADLAEQRPASYAKIAHIQVMGGALDAAPIEGATEWNAAADPDSFATVLAGSAPVTIVPIDAIPMGTPPVLTRSVIAPLIAAGDVPQWWDLSTSAALVVPNAAIGGPGSWTVDDVGTLTRTGAGTVVVVTSLDATQLSAAFEATLS